MCLNILARAGEYLSVRKYSKVRIFARSVTKLLYLIGAIYCAKVRFNISARLTAVEGVRIEG